MAVRLPYYMSTKPFISIQNALFPGFTMGLARYVTLLQIDCFRFEIALSDILS